LIVIGHDHDQMPVKLGTCTTGSCNNHLSNKIELKMCYGVDIIHKT